MSKSKTRRLLLDIVHHGLMSTEGVKPSSRGVFEPRDPPSPPTATIVKKKVASTLAKQCTKAMEHAPLQSGTDDGKGAPMKFITLWPTDVSSTSVASLGHNVMNRIMAIVPSCRSLLQTVARDADRIPEHPTRMFLSLYPAGTTSGLRRHVDDNAPHGAVTMCLTDDKPEEGFFTCTRTGARKVDVPLKAGQAVAIHPSWHHGVHECTRAGNRLSITLFF